MWLNCLLLQGQFYQDVDFPAIFHSVSTSRIDPNNAILVSRFCNANLNRGDIGKGKREFLFLDMQAVNEREIEAGGLWNDFLLVSWGLVYKVVRRVSLHDSGHHHIERSDNLMRFV